VREVEPADLARGRKRVPRQRDRLGGVGGPDGDGDAEAQAVTAAADLRDKVSSEDGRDHLGGKFLGELVGDPVPRGDARVRYLENDPERLIRHLRRLTRTDRTCPAVCHRTTAWLPTREGSGQKMTERS
jgi:hypothetical protein